MVPLHVAAQSVAWFVGFLLLVIVFVLWRDYRKEMKESKKDVRVR